MAGKQKYLKLTTPKGKAIYPHLTTPDTYEGKSKYKVSLAVPSGSAEELVSKIDEVIQQAIKDGKKEYATYLEKCKKDRKKPQEFKEANLPYFTDAETDETIFKFSMNATYERNGETHSLTPFLCDAKRNQLNPKDLKIGGGSILKVNFEVVPFYTVSVGAGVTLRLNAVQVLELRSFAGNGASGFTEEEGFTAEEQEDNSKSPEDSSSSTDDSGDVSDGSDF